MSERDSNSETLSVHLLKLQRYMEQMNQESEKEWPVIENRLDLTLACDMTTQILVAYDELSFEEIMLSFYYIFVGISDGQSVFSVNFRSEEDFCNKLLNNLVKIMEKLTICSSKLEMFKVQTYCLSDEAKFGMSTLMLRIISTICVHLQTTILTTKNVFEHITSVKPLLQELTDDFLMIKLWLYDFICGEFSSRNDFRVLVNNCGPKVRSPNLPHHPCNGPFTLKMKSKFEIVKRNLGSENYECVSCKVPLNDLECIAIWPDCQHVCYCAECARSIFIGKIFSGREVMENIKDGSIQKSRLLIENECPKCLMPISVWSIGKYFSAVIGVSPDPLPSASKVLREEYRSLRSVVYESWAERRTVSYVLSLLLQATFYLFQTKYTATLDSDLNLIIFKWYPAILLQLCFDEINGKQVQRGNVYLLQINIRCLQEAIPKHFKNNLSLYSGPDTAGEFLSLLTQIEMKLDDLKLVVKLHFYE